VTEKAITSFGYPVGSWTTTFMLEWRKEVLMVVMSALVFG